MQEVGTKIANYFATTIVAFASAIRGLFMEQDCIMIYLNQINKIPLLSPEEENELAVKAAAGNTAAKNKIVIKFCICKVNHRFCNFINLCF